MIQMIIRAAAGPAPAKAARRSGTMIGMAAGALHGIPYTARAGVVKMICQDPEARDCSIASLQTRSNPG